MNLEQDDPAVNESQLEERIPEKYTQCITHSKITFFSTVTSAPSKISRRPACRTCSTLRSIHVVALALSSSWSSQAHRQENRTIPRARP